ncbi:MAG: M56 family metallopeptidase [Bacteroidales bacterium]|nr:M56 family metallopeptidase [Bacteroidales bacterium]
MNEFGIFLYESGISLSVLYIFYWFLLRKETYFSLNRIILVSTLLLALIIPFIRITITGHAEKGSIVYVFNRFIMDPLVVSPETVHAEKIQSISLIQIIYFIYFSGVIFFSLKFFVQFFQIFKLLKKYGTRKLHGYKIVPIDNNLSPFSFFNFIFINPEKIQENELKNVLYHEGEHARRLHTLDIILLETICIIQWFNPFIWFYKLALREIHEYEADLRVIKNGENKLNYQQLILQQVFGNQFFQVVHHLLTNSLTKKRITMMTKIESKKRTIIKSLFVLPIAAILVMTFSFTRGTEPNDLLDNSVDKEMNNTQPITTQDQDTTIPEQIFFIVEEMPSFQEKGLNGFRDWVMKQLKYPEIAAKKGIEGVVYIQFVVNKQGNVTTTTILRGADTLLDAEALRVVKSSPQWMPGKQRGQEVNVAFTFPVKFALQEPEKTEPEKKVIPVEKIKQEKPVVKEEIPEGEIFFIVEDMPIFPHDSLESMDAFRNYVMYNLSYPEEAAKKGINGKVFVQFVVDKNGDVKNVEIEKGADPLLNAEAIRVVKSSPRWIPGKQRGQVVNVAFTFPIMFVLQ